MVMTMWITEEKAVIDVCLKQLKFLVIFKVILSYMVPWTKIQMYV
jgi:hypothetical protein